MLWFRRGGAKALRGEAIRSPFRSRITNQGSRIAIDPDPDPDPDTDSDSDSEGDTDSDSEGDGEG